MKKLLLTLTILSCFFCTGCGPQGNTVVAPTDNELTAEEAKAQEEDDEEDHQWTHFGGGSSYDMSSNSTILDAEIL